MSSDERLGRGEAEQRAETYRRLAHRRRTIRRAGHVTGVTLSVVLVSGTLVLAGLGLSGLRGPEPAAPVSRPVAISAGTAHTCALMASGDVRCWGLNDSGQLGIPAGQPRSRPVDVEGLDEKVASISAGGSFTCAVTVDGAAVCWGANGWGQLGNGSRGDSAEPVVVAGLSSGVAAVGAGYDHACAVLTTGTVRCWGRNIFAQLGTGEVGPPERRPVEVVGLSGVESVGAGQHHACAVLVSGGVRCWGDNGLSEVNARPGGGRLPPTRILGIDPDVAAITAGSAHTCAITSLGAAQCWGYNWEGQLGAGTKGNPVPGVHPVVGLSSGVSWISASRDHTCAVIEGGGVRCWGDNSFGALGGLANPRSNATPVDVPDLLSGAVSVEAGLWHTCALMTTGEVRCWGDNQFSQLGVRGGPQPTPVTVEGLHPDQR